MVINTEWGAFGEGGTIDYLMNEFDRQVDEESTYPGQYTFDKLVAGVFSYSFVLLAHLQAPAWVNWLD